MKALIIALAASVAMIACAPAFAAKGSNENAGYAQKADDHSGRYAVARNGADDGKHHDEFDDHSGR